MMKPIQRIPWLILVCLCVCFWACQHKSTRSPSMPRAHQGVLDLRGWDFTKNGPVKLHGEWDLYWKQLLPGTTDGNSFKYASRTGWIHVPREWDKFEIQGKRLPGMGYATFRLQVKLPRSDVYSFSLGYQRTAYRMWVNGRVLASNGVVADRPEQMKPQYRHQTSTRYIARTPADIVLQISNFYHARGGFKNEIWLGIPSQISSMRDDTTFIEWFLIGGLIAMGLYHFIIFLYRRRDYSLLYLAISCLVMAVRQSVTDSILLMYLFPNLSWQVLMKIDYITFYLAPPLLSLYMQHVFPKDFSIRFLRFTLWVSALCCGVAAIFPFQIHHRLLLPYQLFTFLVLVVVAGSIGGAIKQQRERALLIFVGGMIVILTGLNDILHAQGVIHSRPLIPFALFLFLFFQSIVLALRFQRMAQELYARSERLERHVEQMVLDGEERQKGATESVLVHLPMDRRLALAQGHPLESRPQGAVLFADISGFTPLTASLAQELGRSRGAEELIRHLNRVYEALIAEVHRYGGSVITFTGDAITCWFEQSPLFSQHAERRVVGCATAMQVAMRQFWTVITPVGSSFSLHLKTAVVAGSVRRMLVGEPAIQRMEVLAGQILDELAVGEKLAKPDELLVSERITQTYPDLVSVAQWREDEKTQLRFAVVSELLETISPDVWPTIPADSIQEEQVRAWLLKPVYEKVLRGQSHYLSELRMVSALFLQFQGIDYEFDPLAEQKFDQFLCWVQRVLTCFRGSMLQISTGEKGSYLYAVFGVPVTHEDDAVRAVYAAQWLQAPPEELAFVSRIQIGLARGQMRTGPYGSPNRRTYGAVGDKVNLAARLMVAAKEHILCDASIEEAARDVVEFASLEPIQVKGKTEKVSIFRPVFPEVWGQRLLDQLSPSTQLALKVASLLGESWDRALLQAVFPLVAERKNVPVYIQELISLRIVEPDSKDPENRCMFRDPMMRQIAEERMLFSQRRQIHREAAVWYETRDADTSGRWYDLLIYHWEQAEDVAKTILYLEKGGEQARQAGHHQQAMEYFNKALALEQKSSVVSVEYYTQLGKS